MKTLKKLQDLIDNNKELLNINIEKRHCFMENGVISRGANKEDENGFHYIDHNFRLMLQVEQMPSQSGPLLMLLVQQFVNALKGDDQKEWSIEIDVNEDYKTVDVEIGFDVTEPHYLVEVNESPIEINGKKMGYGTHNFDVAESATLK
jgi:hypothetical protein